MQKYYYIFCHQAACLVMEGENIERAERFDFDLMRFVPDNAMIQRISADMDVQQVSEHEAWAHCRRVKKHGNPPTAAKRLHERTLLELLGRDTPPDD